MLQQVVTLLLVVTSVHSQALLSTDDLLRVYVPSSSVIDNEMCNKHSAFYMEGIKNKQKWALKMLQSSSKIPSGVLQEQMVQLGDYDECLDVHNVHTSDGHFSGQHCMAQIGPKGFFTALTFYDKGEAFPKLDEFLRLVEETKSSNLSEVLTRVGITWSVCIPSTCRPRDLQDHLQRSFQRMFGNVSVLVNELACNSKAEQSNPISFRGKFVILLVTSILAFVVGGSLYDIYFQFRGSGQPIKFILAFSAPANIRTLFRAPRLSDANMAAIDGIRFLNVAWVILTHKYLFVFLSPLANFEDLRPIYSSLTYIFVSNGTLSVDSFLLLSGLLVAYNFFQEREKGTEFRLLHYYFHRYVRLTPAYAFMFLVSAMISTNEYSGPYDKINMNDVQNSCWNFGWTGLLYVNNYMDQEHLCVPVSWYLGVDMQLFWISPLILFPLWRKPSFGKSLLAALVVAGVVIGFLISYANKFPVRFCLNTIASIEGLMLYFPTHVRFTPWLIGVGLGYLLYNASKDSSKLSSVKVTVGWTLSAVLQLSSLFLAHHFIQPDYKYNRVLSSLYAGCVRPAWALGLAWVIFACVRGHGGKLNSFLSHPVFRVLGRISYSIFMTHWIVLGTPNKTAYYYNDTNVIIDLVSATIRVLLAALVFYLFVEAPTMLIRIEIYNRANKSRTVKKTR